MRRLRSQISDNLLLLTARTVSSLIRRFRLSIAAGWVGVDVAVVVLVPVQIGFD